MGRGESMTIDQFYALLAYAGHAHLREMWERRFRSKRLTQADLDTGMARIFLVHRIRLEMFSSCPPLEWGSLRIPRSDNVGTISTNKYALKTACNYSLRDLCRVTWDLVQPREVPKDPTLEELVIKLEQRVAALEEWKLRVEAVKL